MHNLVSSTEHLSSFYLWLFQRNWRDMSERSQSSGASSEQLAHGFLSCYLHLFSGLPYQRCLVSKKQLVEEDGSPTSLRSQTSRILLHARATWLPILLLQVFSFSSAISLALGLRMRQGRRNMALSSWTTVPFIYHLQCEYVWCIMFTNLKSFEPNMSLVEWTILRSHYSINFSLDFFPKKDLESIERF